MHPTLAAAFETELASARTLLAARAFDPAFRHLERAHVLGQRSVTRHVRAHAWMLVVALRRRDSRELAGQLLRLVLAAPSSAVGLVPTGNTGGANVSAVEPMPIAPDLQRLLELDEARRSGAGMRPWKRGLRVGYAPLFLIGGNALAIHLVASRGPGVELVLLLLGAIALSFGAERILPYQPAWNRSHGDAGRDVAHALANETLAVLSVASVPLVSALRGPGSAWPTELPFLFQVLLAVLVADLGITLVHLASHRVGWLWRLHAVHHSVKRLYGMNGLMKHPLHQALETLGGTLPLLLLGLPIDVAAALAFCVAIQLLLQHSNVDYTVGPLRWLLATSEVHRFHHRNASGLGDVNFGLFTNVWDRVLGTVVYEERPERFTSAELGIDGEPDYPTRWTAQLVRPFEATPPR